MKRIALSAIILLCIITSYGQLNVTEAGKYSYSETLSDIWGYADEDGNEYALVGVYNGFSIVDVTDPSELEEVFFESGVMSIWRDIKTWGDYAYVSTEGGDGIIIVDMSPLPGEVSSTAHFTGVNYPFSTVHNIYIDESGKLYIFGADNGAGGAIICDLTADPMNPVELGQFDDYYLHDGMARGDTLWGGALYAGLMVAVDVSNPAATNIMGSVSTPNQFTHNAWVSDNGEHVFTTDEKSGAFVAAYNVTDMNDIYETDRVQSNPGSGVIPHNAHVNNDFIVTSYYTDGVIIHDADRPGNIIEVGNFDTSPEYEGVGFNGCWGAYPFLPSGNILASDMQEGLYVLETEYVRGCYVEGIVTDSVTGLPLVNTAIKIAGTEYLIFSDLDGTYAFGTPISGTYDIEYTHEDYPMKTMKDVELENGVLTELNIELSNWITAVEEKLINDDISVFPNPSASSFTVKYSLKNTLSADAAILIYDLNGRMLVRKSLNKQEGTVNIGNDLPRGSYFVKISNGEELVQTKRISKL